MEKRTKIPHELITTKMFEAVVRWNKTGMTTTITKDSKKYLESELNVYLKDSTYSLVSIEEVERTQIKL